MSSFAVCLLVALVGVICVAVILGGDWQNVAVLTAYNKSTVYALQRMVRSHSHYYALETPKDHRAYVGGAWEEIGALELAFLRSKGLKQTHRLLDVGCGALRGGVHFVRYLDPHLYFGIDLNPHLLDAGHQKELDDALRQKCPRSQLRATANFDATAFGVPFDFALAVSVWTHLPIQAIEGSLKQVAAVLARPHGAFYATFYACPENAPLAKQILQFRDGRESIISHGDRDWFHQKASAIRKAARKAGLKMRFLGDVAYPRALRNVLSDPSDRAHLSRIYFEKILPRHNSPTYYNLLHHLASEKADERAWSALEKVRSVVHDSFGAQFEIINDFYSFRSKRKQIFPNWHQDIEFWLTGDSCDGFNIWVLLDHHRMNYSFDVYDVNVNHELYDGLYRALHRKYGRVPLEAGDALIVRQIEIHRTDMHPLDEHQWRLALGFKVLRKDIAVRTATTTSSPFGYDLASCRARWPGLIPPMDVGKTLPHVYNRSSLASMGPLRASTSGMAREMLMWVLGTPIMLVPLLGIGLIACAARSDRMKA